MDLLSTLPEDLKGQVQASAAEETSAANGEGVVKRRGIVPQIEEKLTDQVMTSSKLNLWCAQQVRQLKGQMVSCFRLADKSKYVLAINAEVQSFQKAQTKLLESGKDQEEVDKILGVMHMWAFNGMIKAALEDDKLDLAKKEKIKEGMKEWMKDKEELEMHVTHCRVSRMYSSDVKRLEISVPFLILADQLDREKGYFTATSACKLILAVLPQQPRFRRLPGIAPAGKLEKDLQKMVGDK